MSDKREILDDQKFWARLEHAASLWLESSDDRNLRRFWIDGFLPETISNARRGVDVKGMVWVGEGGRIQYEYRFVVSVPQKMLHRQRKSFLIERLDFDEEKQLLEMVLIGGDPTVEKEDSGEGSRQAEGEEVGDG